MCTLNRAGMELALPFEVHAATDITGFGLLGHAREMAVGSKVSFAIDSQKIEYLPEALNLAQKGFLPGGLKRNMDFIGGCVEFAPDVPEDVRNLLFDPQTSGGLLLSVASKDAAPLLDSLRANGVDAQQVGEVTRKDSSPHSSTMTAASERTNPPTRLEPITTPHRAFRSRCPDRFLFSHFQQRA